MKEKIEEIINNSYVNMGDFDQAKAVKELLILFDVKVCSHPYDSVRIDMNKGFKYCNDCKKKLK